MWYFIDMLKVIWMDESTSGVPMTIAVAEFKGPDVHGVVRFAQENSGLQECSIEAIIDGLAPGAHGWAVHEYGDLTRGALSTGPASNFPSSANSPTPVSFTSFQHPVSINHNSTNYQNSIKISSHQMSESKPSGKS